jgi:MoaA/NifB/PqqE/SkfB family radical SAM enzyme
MLISNPGSGRTNPFRQVYDNADYKGILDKRDSLPVFPFLVDVEVTNHCNLRCIMCQRHAMTREEGYMSGELFRTIVEECAGHSAPIRIIRYGEPFLHPNIIEFCAYAKSRGILLHITTNGLKITDSHIKALVDLEVDSIIFSFQGTTRERYRQIRNNRLHERLERNIKALIATRARREKPFVHVSTTVLDDSSEEIDAFVNYWGGIVDSVGVGKTNLTRVSSYELPPPIKRRLAALKQSETIKKVYRPCTEVYQKLSVDWDGKVTACCSDFDQLLTVGDLADSTLSEIWNHSRVLAMSRALLDAGRHRSLSLCSHCYHTYEEF